MGGFAHGTTVNELRDKLASMGVEMIECSGINFRNYGWSFVCVRTSKQADYLVSQSPIVLRNRNIDVRPFIDRQKVVCSK